ARKFISEEDFNESLEKCTDSLIQLREKTGLGAEWLGWRDLLQLPNDA
ncbi:MAG TPA: glucose-6-phosphate isomerase, partial [Balneola sp.]|nr:glucose-6-phosphate isomerase [Balneola sp.]